MKKSALALLLAGAMAVGTVPATVMAEEAAKPYEGVTLSMWIYTAEYNEGTQAIMAKATEELGMEFAIEISPGGTEGDNLVKTKCASGDLPDIVNYNSGSLLTALNPKEHFLDITDEEMTAKFDEAFTSTVSQDDRIYGAPFTTTQGGAVIYWKPDYEELGLEVPNTWDEFVANCNALKEAGKTPCYLSAGDTWTTQLVFLGDNYNVLASNPDFAEQFTAGTAKFASEPGALRSWEKYADLVDMYNADYTAAKYDDGLEAMATGQATHWFMLTQVVPAMIANHPEAAENYGIKQRVYVAVIDMPVLVEKATFDRKYEAIAKFPAMKRDLSMTVSKDVFVGQLEAVIKENGGKLLESVELFDVYEGNQIKEGFKSVAYALTFRAKDRTLEENEVNKLVDKILKKLSDLGAQLRE